MEVKFNNYGEKFASFKVDYHSIKVTVCDGSENEVTFSCNGKELVAAINALATALPNER